MQETSNEQRLELRCPSCGKDHDLGLQEEIKCPSCSSTFFGFLYEPIKAFSFVGTLLAVGAGAMGFNVIDNRFFSDDRYPMEDEFTIMLQCSQGSSVSRTAENQRRVVSMCACITEKTMTEVSLRDYREMNQTFVQTFNQNIDECDA